MKRLFQIKIYWTHPSCPWIVTDSSNCSWTASAHNLLVNSSVPEIEKKKIHSIRLTAKCPLKNGEHVFSIYTVRRHNKQVIMNARTPTKLDSRLHIKWVWILRSVGNYDIPRHMFNVYVRNIQVNTVNRDKYVFEHMCSKCARVHQIASFNCFRCQQNDFFVLNSFVVACRKIDFISCPNFALFHNFHNPHYKCRKKKKQSNPLKYLLHYQCTFLLLQPPERNHLRWEQ